MTSHNPSIFLYKRLALLLREYGKAPNSRPVHFRFDSTVKTKHDASAISRTVHSLLFSKTCFPWIISPSLSSQLWVILCLPPALRGSWYSFLCIRVHVSHKTPGSAEGKCVRYLFLCLLLLLVLFMNRRRREKVLTSAAAITLKASMIYYKAGEDLSVECYV